MTHRPANRGRLVLFAASVTSAVLGSIHAFSVFLAPLETAFSATRSTVSLTYSLALAALTLAVLLGPRIFARWSAASFTVGTMALAAVGAMLAGMGQSLWMVWLGYSLIFGLANGLGYGFGLQIAAQYSPGREGFAMGVVTASYALGAMVSPAAFEAALTFGGFGSAMLFLAAALIISGGLSAVMMRRAEARFQAEPDVSATISASPRSQILLWIGYFGGVLAGLMVIGHAAGIAATLRPGTATWVAPALIAACNLTGSLVAGRLADRISLAVLLTALALLTALSLGSLVLIGPILGVLVVLGVTGFAYGGTIAAYPAAIAKLNGMEQSAAVYGRIFTAWGAAGLVGPWLAGRLFDLSGDYRMGLLAASLAALLPVGAIPLVFRKPRAI